MQVSERGAAERWSTIVEERRQQMDSAYTELERTSRDFWPRRGNRLQMLRRPIEDEDVLLRRALSYCQNGTALDAGAGAGRYSIALARHGVNVTAVEPETVMLDALREDAAAAGVDSIQIVQRTWQEAEIEPADAVLCAHVIYPFAELEPFVAKLDRHAKRAVLLALMGTWREPEVLSELWRRFHGTERLQQPGYLDAYLVLHAMGIPANVEIVPAGGNSWPFTDLDDAVAAVREHLIVPATPEADAIIRRALDAALLREDGRLSLPPVERFTAIIWWERQGPRL